MPHKEREKKNFFEIKLIKSIKKVQINISIKLKLNKSISILIIYKP
jgi:hypothetical protein